MINFSWQAQCLVMLEGNLCCSAHCKHRFICDEVHYLVKFKCHFSWQAQYLVKLKSHFSLQVQHLVKFRMIAGARNVVFFNRKCSW